MRKNDFIFIGLLILGIVVGLFYDIQIASALFQPNDFVANVIDDYANLLAYAVGTFALIGLSLNETDLIKKTVYESLVIFLLIAVSFITHLKMGFDLIDTSSFTFLTGYGIYYFVHHHKAFKSSNFKKWFLFASISFICLLIVPNVIKMFILRFRPYLFMGGCLDYSFYLKWLPFNFQENFRSFPSFHTSMSTVLLVFTVFPHQSEKARNLRSYRAVLWIGIVMYYRMVVGAHFLTDTLVSILMAYIILRICYLRIVK